jgi:hypothetical protein
MRIASVVVLGITASLMGCGGGEEPAQGEAPWAGGPGGQGWQAERDDGPGFVFVDVTRSAGIDFTHVTGAFGDKWMPETLGSGGGFLDYDGDGRLDLFLVNSAEWPGRETGPPAHSRLYRNLGDGTFRDVSAATGIDRLTAGTYGMGSVFGDYDGDGDPDIYVTAVGENLLLENREGRFLAVAGAGGATGSPPGSAGSGSWSTAAAWLDADRDGFLDLLVCNYVRWTPETDLFTTRDGVTKSYATPEHYDGESCRLYRNREGAGFDDVTADAGLENPDGKSLGVVVEDFDDDGWPDVFVANDMQPNFLYMNDGDGTFSDAALSAGVAFDEFGRARAGMGVDVADVAGSGEVSIAIGNFSNEPLSLYTPVGGGVFQDLAGSARLTRPTLLPLTFGVAFVDLDLDGFQDLVTANGHIEPEIGRISRELEFEQRPQVFRNTGRGGFVEATQRAGEDFSRPAVARGLAFGDYDEDGDPDLLITVNGGSPRLLRNDTPSETLGNWTGVRLEGAAPNRDAVGATVTLYVGDRTLRRSVRAGSSYLSQSAMNPVLFGLGEAEAADSIVVRWPRGGRTVSAGPFPAGTTAVVREDGPSTGEMQ